MASELKDSDEWQAATSYALTDEDIARAELLLGVDTASRERQYIQTATTDNIRNFAFGTGNDNPLFCEPDYARGARFGSVIAPGMMAGVINAPMKGDPINPDLKARTKQLFKGVHVFVSGADWEWYRPVFPGDTLFMFSGDDTQEVKQSEFSGRSVIRVRRDVKINQRAEVVAVYRSLRVLTERKTAAKKGKYLDIQPTVYSEEDMANIDEVYSQEKVQGATARRWEDVQVGDSMGVMAKGPLTVTDVMVFHAGGYGFVPYAPAVGRLAWRNRQRIPAFYVKNEYGVPDVAQRLHGDPLWARAIGNPMAYDYGVMRENYIYHYLTDWAGDDGLVLRQHDEVRKFNYIGDTTMITGEVVGKRREGAHNLVDVKVRCLNQRNEETVSATATLALPGVEGVAVYPEPPPELARKAQAMMARHWRLSAGRN